MNLSFQFHYLGTRTDDSSNDQQPDDLEESLDSAYDGEYEKCEYE